jgi:hypothetical protein
MSRFKAVLSIASIGALATVGIGTSTARAHFLQLKPDSWLTEESDGSPQKGAPCGPKGYDDVDPIPTSGKATTFHAGEMIELEVQETVHHPGYFRVSLAQTDAMSATTTDFPNPPLDDDAACSLDLDAVPTGSHDNVLEDGLFKDDDMFGDNRHLTQMIKLPDEPCEHCTLQIVQVMKDHMLNSCFYYHCADITILPADGTSSTDGGTMMGTGGTTSMSGSGGMGTAGTGSGDMKGSGGGAANPMTGSGGVTSGGTATTGSGGMPSPSGSGGMPATSGTGGEMRFENPMKTPESKDSGCSVVRARSEAPSAIAEIAGAFVLGIAAARLRRRRAAA